jgi:thiol-disulfide isomerase/thioredoxin
VRSVFTGVIGLTWAALMLGGAFRPAMPTATAGSRPDPGYIAPSFPELQALQGKAVYLNFWASWCGPCRLEMPEIERLSNHLPPNTAVLTVSLDSQSEVARTFFASKGYTYPVIMDPEGIIGDRYRAISFPTNLFISPSGRVTARVNGPLSYSSMLDFLTAAGR